MANCLLYLESFRELPVLVELMAALIKGNERSDNGILEQRKYVSWVALGEEERLDG